MEARVTILGTAASVPTPQRAVSATVLSLSPTRVLIDCGEGTQRRLGETGEMAEIDVVCLTHLHADHTLGLPGLLATWALGGRTRPLPLYGPKGTRRWMERAAFFIGKLSFAVEVTECVHGDTADIDRGQLCAVATDHGVPSLGWIWREDSRPGTFDAAAAHALGIPQGPLWGQLQRGQSVTVDGQVIHSDAVVEPTRRGRIIAISGDTSPCDQWITACAGADVMIHEATFLHTDVARARQRHHSTGRQAAQVARDAGVQQLVMTHLSSRTWAKQVLQEAHDVGIDAWVAQDGDVIEVPYPERGVPTLTHAS